MKKENQYVIGVDGGGTKTIAALANLKGKILKISKTGPSNLRNIGMKRAISNISEAILKVIKGIERKKISSIFIALAAIEEEFKSENEKIKREISRRLNFKGLQPTRHPPASRAPIETVSDQIVAFRAGVDETLSHLHLRPAKRGSVTDKKDGIVLISGTGCVCHGWRGTRETKVSGWGWLDDEGSGFWAGQKGYQAVFKNLDGRGPKTKITKLLFKEWKLKRKEDLMKKVYGKDSIRNISLISRIIDKASQKGDRVAKLIMEEAGEELALLAISVIKKLNFQNKKFPLVLVGKMFNSKIVLNKVKREVKKIAPKTQFIIPKSEPAIGAIKLAIKSVK